MLFLLGGRGCDRVLVETGMRAASYLVLSCVFDVELRAEADSINSSSE